MMQNVHDKMGVMVRREVESLEQPKLAILKDQERYLKEQAVEIVGGPLITSTRLAIIVMGCSSEACF